MKTMHILGAAALAAMGAGADAAVTATFTGVITSGTDINGYFGNVGADLTGENYSVVYSLDESTPGAKFTDLGGTTYLEGRPSPVSGTLTIGSKSFTVPDGVQGYARQDKYPQFEQVQYRVDGQALGNPSHYYALTSTVSSGAGPGHDFLSSSNYRTDSDYEVQSDGVLSYFQDRDTVGGVEDIELGINHVSVKVSGAPEPATWAMMTLGIGMVGWRLRRKTGASAPVLSIA